MLNRHLLFFGICQSNDDVHVLLLDVTDTRNDSVVDGKKVTGKKVTEKKSQEKKSQL